VEVEDLYNSMIVSRSRSPEFSGVVVGETNHAEGNNPLCGDRVRLTLRCEDGRVAEAAHQTRGCAICIASADLLAEAVAGQAVRNALQMADQFVLMFENEDAGGVLPGNLQIFLPLRQHRARIRCATLPWIALKEALAHDAE
jgi:nitrogen fixation NifU-like protein